jgi:hypothetical protein
MTIREGSEEEKLYLDVPFPDNEQVKAAPRALASSPSIRTSRSQQLVSPS